MSAAEHLARRFLHVNLNCGSLATTEALYVDQLGLSARMRTDPDTATDGSILGIDSETYCATAFLYDIRGGRGGCALETIEYRTPELVRDPSADPVRPGIRSTLMTVADLPSTVARLRSAGVRVGEPVEGLVSGRESVLALDPDGALVELTQAGSGVDDASGALFDGLRIASIDAHATAEFLTGIGFVEVQELTRTKVSGEQLAPGGSGDAVECVVGRFALPEDGEHFSITVVAHPGTAGQAAVPWGGNRQGLYRCALRVENVESALSVMPNSIKPMGDPVWCPLPGTKIDGLYIAFLRSPDGVVFEFVERPIRHFGVAG
jgi:catechol 2,3-dioxygenase-like lactoylglutathione lyase family enzyme